MSEHLPLELLEGGGSGMVCIVSTDGHSTYSHLLHTPLLTHFQSKAGYSASIAAHSGNPATEICL